MNDKERIKYIIDHWHHNNEERLVLIIIPWIIVTALFACGIGNLFNSVSAALFFAGTSIAIGAFVCYRVLFVTKIDLLRAIERLNEAE